MHAAYLLRVHMYQHLPTTYVSSVFLFTAKSKKNFLDALILIILIQLIFSIKVAQFFFPKTCYRHVLVIFQKKTKTK